MSQEYYNQPRDAAHHPPGPPPSYFHPPYRTHQPTTHSRRPSLVSSLAFLARPFTLVVPGIIVILNIWWSVTQRVCPRDAGVGDTCFWMLWLSLPIATLSFAWAIALNISARRRAHHMSSIPQRVLGGVQLLLALGTTVCFALMIYHLVHYDDIWSESSEGAMAALVGILMLTNWALFASTAQEMHKDYRERQHASSQIPI